MADKFRLVVEYTPKEKKFILGSPLIHPETTIGQLRDVVRKYLEEHYDVRIPSDTVMVIRHQKTGADVRDAATLCVIHFGSFRFLAVSQPLQTI
jgi:hypothetical protein